MGVAGNRGRGHLNQTGDGAYFDALVDEDGDFNPFTQRGWRTLARRFARVVPNRNLRMLDVGCGTGRSHGIYAERCSSYVGIDLSLQAVRVASKRIPHAVLQADALALPFAEHRFDVVAFSSVLHHIDRRRVALAEASRVLHPGGWVFAFDPNLLHPAMMLFRHPRSPWYSPAGVSPNERPLLPSALREDFAAAGFVDVGQRCQSDLPYRKVALPALNAVLPVYNAADWLWERAGIGRWLGSFVVTWGRKA